MTHEPCQCLSEFNAKLADHNTRICETLGLPRDGSPSFTRPTISTEKIETRKRVGPAIAVPSFCPFCGKPYGGYGSVPALPNIHDRLFHAEVRIEAMWPFPVSPASEALGDVFEYADDEQDLPEPLRSLITSLDERSRDDLYNGNGHDFQEAFSELCAAAARKGVHGWIAIAANPVAKPASGGGVSFSWGYYHTKVMFAGPAEELLEAAAEWGEAQFAAAHAQAGGDAA